MTQQYNTPMTIEEQAKAFIDSYSELDNCAPVTKAILLQRIEKALIERERITLEMSLNSLSCIIPFGMIATESDAPWAVDKCKEAIRQLIKERNGK